MVALMRCSTVPISCHLWWRSI